MYAYLSNIITNVLDTIAYVKVADPFEGLILY